MDAPSHEPLFTIRHLTKSYATPVLVGLDLDIRPGEVHALMGANGAGKSTLARIICGLTPADAGTMTLAGEPYRPSGRADAEACGVQLVPQEPDFLPTLSISENLLLGRWPARLGIVAYDRLQAEARRALAVVGLQRIDPATSAAQLGVGERHLVSIAAALARRCRLLVLDEPTAALTDPQVEQLFHHVRRLRSEGVAIVFVSHRHDELRRIADRISVLRDGRLVATRPAGGLALEEAVRLMVGEELSAVYAPPPTPPSPGGEPVVAPPLDKGGLGGVRTVPGSDRTLGSVALRVQSLRCGDRVRDVSFDLHNGEILGVAGLVGSGRTELLRAIFGADPPEAGTLIVGDDLRPRRFRHPRDAVRAGLGMVPEDRKLEGLLLPLPIAVNLSLARLDLVRSRFGRLDRRRELEAAEQLGERVQLRGTRSVHQPAAELSGGNQQKVVVGRWLWHEPKVLLLDEPTRGVDVAAKRTIHALIADLARRGRAILVVSSDLEELMSLSDRIVVLSAGRLVATFVRATWTHQAILAAAFHEYTGRGAAGEA